MSNVEIFNSIGTGIALVIAIGTYLIHDRKIKRQEALLNDHQLKKNQEEEAEQKKAKVRANIIKGDKGRRIIKIFNSGKATARNVNCEFLGEPNFYNSGNPFPFEFMHPSDSTEMVLHLHTGSPDKATIRVTWDDDHMNENTHEQILTF